MTIRTTVAQVLTCFDGEFAEVAKAFARGEYLLWLGSGISRGVVPGVSVLLERMISFLQSNVNGADPTCRFRKALDEVLDVAGLPVGVRGSIDLATPVDRWPELEDIVSRLVDKYSDVLDIQVQGEPEDYLVWSGLDVSATYGAPGLVPDVEHLCVGLLMLEGVVRSAPTTNWDGLVEAGMERLTGSPDAVLRVIVRPSDFRDADRQAELVKFHGCAVRAAISEADYRHLLIARKSQISGWTTKPENQLMMHHLEHLFASRPALIVGLSAQDANIHTMLHAASRSLAREWPTSPPAVVFAEQHLGYHHKHVMKMTYGDFYTPNSDAIGRSALLGAYAKPALTGLLLFTLADKLCALIDFVPELNLTSGEIDTVRAGVHHLRDVAGRLADADPRAFIEALVSTMTLTLSVFRQGRIPDPHSLHYQPISSAPITRALADPDFPCAALGRLAIAVALLGRGEDDGRWRLELGSPATPSQGVLRLESRGEVCRVFIVRDSRALAQLEADGIVDHADQEVLVIHAEAARRPTVRSPRGRYGRTGHSGARYVDLEGLCATVHTTDELFEWFRLEGALP